MGKSINNLVQELQQLSKLQEADIFQQFLVVQELEIAVESQTGSQSPVVIEQQPATKQGDRTFRQGDQVRNTNRLRSCFGPQTS